VNADVSVKHSVTIFSKGVPNAVKVHSLYFRALTPSYQARRLFIAQEHDMNCSVFVTGNLEDVHDKIF